jgi:hypothetical protein
LQVSLPLLHEPEQHCVPEVHATPVWRQHTPGVPFVVEQTVTSPNVPAQQSEAAVHA